MYYYYTLTCLQLLLARERNAFVLDILIKKEARLYLPTKWQWLKLYWLDALLLNRIEQFEQIEITRTNKPHVPNNTKRSSLRACSAWGKHVNMNDHYVVLMFSTFLVDLLIFSFTLIQAT